MRLFLSLLVGKFITAILRLRGSEGTALPGLIVEKIDPNFLRKVRSSYIKKLVVVTGTNGKTTTQTLLARVLQDQTSANEKIIVNSKGANLKRGLISELVKQLPLFSSKRIDYAIFEVEEATYPRITEEIKADIAIVTNFFRDQLDAYGEISRTKKHVEDAIAAWPKTEVIANYDDPHVLDCIKTFSERLSLVSIAGIDKHIEYEAHEDRKQLRDSLSEYISEVAEEVSISSNLETVVTTSERKVYLQLPGIYNAYPLLYAVAATKKLVEDYSKDKVYESAESTTPAFGRGELMRVGTSNYKIFLVKNPVGFDLTIDLLNELPKNFNLIILINDNVADGRDVSWLWDSKLEDFNYTKINKIYFSGCRAEDIRLRVKYA
ncbi:MAG: MurT ligase domain-containing protein, partial [Candidatus Dojkabacteria bacterium]